MWFWKKKVKIADPEILNLMNIYLDRLPEIRRDLDSTNIFSKSYESIKESYLNKRYESLFKIYENDPASLACATVDIDQIRKDLVYDWGMTCFPKKNSNFDNIQLLVTVFSRMLKKHPKTVMSWLSENPVSNEINYYKTPEPISKRFGKYNSVRQNREKFFENRPEYAQAMKQMSICS